jgi:hypothetical protein
MIDRTISHYRILEKLGQGAHADGKESMILSRRTQSNSFEDV